jgi:hypothetical protein
LAKRSHANNPSSRFEFSPRFEREVVFFLRATRVGGEEHIKAITPPPPAPGGHGLLPILLNGNVAWNHRHVRMLDAFEVSPLFFGDQHQTIQRCHHPPKARAHVTVLQAHVQIPSMHDADARDLPRFGQGDG